MSCFSLPASASSTSSTHPSILESYGRLLESAEASLTIADEDSMRALKEKVEVFVAAYPDSPLSSSGRLTQYLPTLDGAILRLLSRIAILPPSPDALELRHSLIPLIRARKELIANQTLS